MYLVIRNSIFCFYSKNIFQSKKEKKIQKNTLEKYSFLLQQKFSSATLSWVAPLGRISMTKQQKVIITPPFWTIHSFNSFIIDYCIIFLIHRKTLIWCKTTFQFLQLFWEVVTQNFSTHKSVLYWYYRTMPTYKLIEMFFTWYFSRWQCTFFLTLSICN